MSITLLRPDDWHLHVRDGAALASVVPFTARQFGRALIMPNLKPPITTVAQAESYRQRIQAAVPQGVQFQPKLSLYLTDRTTAQEIQAASQTGFLLGAKLYPAGATTNADAGVTAIDNILPALAALQETGLALQVHGEVTDTEVDIFDRERAFIDAVLQRIVKEFPRLKVVFEHITTAAAVRFVREAREGVAATITPQHLLLNRNAIFQGGIRPHHYCLPVLKRETDRVALLDAATSGEPRFFLGTDSAPHARHTKENACGCAGIFSAHAAIELYAEAFEEAGRLERLQGFASEHGADFYGLERNTTHITLARREWTVPDTYGFGADALVPFRAGQTLRWQLIEDDAS